MSSNWQEVSQTKPILSFTKQPQELICLGPCIFNVMEIHYITNANHVLRIKFWITHCFCIIQRNAVFSYIIKLIEWLKPYDLYRNLRNYNIQNSDVVEIILFQNTLEPHHARYESPPNSFGETQLDSQVPFVHCVDIHRDMSIIKNLAKHSGVQF